MPATCAPAPIVIVGGGKMGEAILAGWIASTEPGAAALGPSDFLVVNPGAERRAHLQQAYGVKCVADVAEMPQDLQPALVVLAVKPQVMMGVLEEIAQLPAFGGGQDGPLFVTIAAGLPAGRIAAALPQGSAVVRVMPNMPLQVSAGASGVCAGKVCAGEAGAGEAGSAPTATDAQVQLVADLFGCLGRAVVVDESQMDAVCALSGSGPAYVAAMIEALAAAAVQQGLPADLADELALQTVLGTAQLINETDLTPAQARQAVCSPGGTTLAALDALYADGFNEMFAHGVKAAVDRSKELAAS